MILTVQENLDSAKRKGKTSGPILKADRGCSVGVRETFTSVHCCLLLPLPRTPSSAKHSHISCPFLTHSNIQMTDAQKSQFRNTLTLYRYIHKDVHLSRSHSFSPANASPCNMPCTALCTALQGD